MNAGKPHDPQWDLAIEIAAKLWIDGQFVTALHPMPTQRFVDLQWAARQAGRVLGGTVTVHTGRSHSTEDPTVTVTVTYVDPTGQGLKRAEEGLEALMRQVMETHADR